MKKKSLGYNKYMLMRDLACLFILGILVGHLISIPIIVWRALFVVLIIIAVVVNFERLNKLEGFVVALTLYCLLLFVVYYDPGDISRFGAILFTVPTLILFNFLDTKGVITQKWINFMCVIFVIAAAIFYRYKESVFLEEFFELADYGFTNNASTVFTGLLVLLLLSDKKLIVWGGFAICWFFLITSSKRGNMVEALIPTMILFFQVIKTGKRKFWTFLLTVAIFAIGIYYGIQVFNENAFLVSKLDAGSNGRDRIWATLLDEWSGSTNFLKIIFGYGLSGTVELTHGMPAHNDWLEILVDYGLVGLAMQIGIFVSLFKFLKIKSPYRLVFIAAVGVWFMKSLVSMGFTDPLNVFTFVTLGIVMSRTLKYKNQKDLINE